MWFTSPDDPASSEPWQRVDDARKGVGDDWLRWRLAETIAWCDSLSSAHRRQSRELHHLARPGERVDQAPIAEAHPSGV